MLVNPAEKLYIKLIGFPNIITNKIALRNEIKNVSLKPISRILKRRRRKRTARNFHLPDKPSTAEHVLMPTLIYFF